MQKKKTPIFRTVPISRVKKFIFKVHSKYLIKETLERFVYVKRRGQAIPHCEICS